MGHELAKHRRINKQLVDSRIVRIYMAYISNKNRTRKAMAKSLGFSVSFIQNDCKHLGIIKKRCRKHVKLSGCCVTGFQDRYKDVGNREFRELGY